MAAGVQCRAANAVGFGVRTVSISGVQGMLFSKGHRIQGYAVCVSVKKSFSSNAKKAHVLNAATHNEVQVRFVRRCQG